MTLLIVSCRGTTRLKIEEQSGLAHLGTFVAHHCAEARVIRKLKTGEYRLYSRKKAPRTGRRRNLGTFKTRSAAEKHERAVQYFKRH
jgi:hypothetical protein